jgi:hypothetical protein
MLIAAILVRRWGAVGTFVYAGIFTAVVMKLVCVPVAARRERRKVHGPAK